MTKRIKPKNRIVINPLESEFDLVSDNNFSYESVPQNKKLVIYENMQMIVMEGFEVDGDLILDGNLYLEE